MSIYENYPLVPGANKTEHALLKTLKGADVVRFDAKQTPQVDKFGERVPRLTKHMYTKFMNGERVPNFVRQKIYQFLCEKSNEIMRVAKKFMCS